MMFMNETKIGEGENEKYHFDWPLCRVPEKLNQISEDSGAPGDLVRSAYMIVLVYQTT